MPLTQMSRYNNNAASSYHPYLRHGVNQIIRRGVRAAGDAYRSYKKPQPGKGRNTIAYTQRSGYNSLAGKVSTKTYGHVTRKGNKKKIKVSKSLREKVKKVIDGEENYGEYRTHRNGLIGIISSPVANATLSEVDDGAIRHSSYLLPGGSAISSATQYWQSGCNTIGTGGITPDKLTFTAGGDWGFFSVLKFLDAASVLFNSKAISSNYTQMPNNFRGQGDKTSGGQTAPTKSEPQLANVKFKVVNSYVKMTFKNLSQREQKIKLYLSQTKQKNTANSPIRSMISALDDVLENSVNGENNMFSVQNNLPGLTMTSEDALCIKDFPIGKIPGFKNAWKNEVVVITIMPGETFTKSIQGPRNWDFDGSNFNFEGKESGNEILQQEIYVSACQQLDPVFVTSNNGISNVALTGNYPHTNSSSDIGNPVHVGVEECFKILMPDIAGFTLEAVPLAGVIHQLDMRKPQRFAVGDFTHVVAPNIDGYSYVNVDEEQPGTVINDGTLN